MDARSVLTRLHRSEPLLLTALIWFYAKFVRFTFPPLFESLQGAYGVSIPQLGAAFTGLMVTYAVMQFPSGVLADRIGSVKVITGGVLIAGTATLTLVTGSTFLLLVGAMVLIGGGTGAHRTVAVRLLSRSYPARTGGAVGLLGAVGTFGGVFAPPAVVIFSGLSTPLDYGWRVLYLLAGLVGVGFAALFLSRVPTHLPDEGDDTSRSGAGATPDFGRYVALFRGWHFAAFLAMSVLFAFAYSGVLAFLPLYLTLEAGLSTPTASVIYSGMFAASLAQLGTGELGDRFGEPPLLVVTVGVAAGALIALVLVATGGDPLAIGVIVVCLGASANGYRPVRSSYFMANVPTSLAGGGLGVVRSTFVAVGAVSPAAVGYASEAAGFRSAFWMLAVAMTGAALMAGSLWIMDARGVTFALQSGDG